MPNKFISNANKVRQTVERHLIQNLNAAALIAQTAAKRNARPNGPSGFRTSRGSGGLVGSIGREVDRRKFTAFIGSNLKYAAIHEAGGRIQSQGKKLAIPLTPEARKSRGPRFMPDLEVIPRRGKNTLLARVDENFDLDPQWVLVDEVKIPKRPYLRPALLKNRAKITRALLRPLPGTRQA